jgi:hypothetical protein
MWPQLLDILQRRVGAGRVTTYGACSEWAFGHRRGGQAIRAMLETAARRGNQLWTNRVVSDDGSCGAADAAYGSRPSSGPRAFRLPAGRSTWRSARPSCSSIPGRAGLLRGGRSAAEGPRSEGEVRTWRSWSAWRSPRSRGCSPSSRRHPGPHTPDDGIRGHRQLPHGGDGPNEKPAPAPPPGAAAAGVRGGSRGGRDTRRAPFRLEVRPGRTNSAASSRGCSVPRPVAAWPRSRPRHSRRRSSDHATSVLRSGSHRAR